MRFVSAFHIDSHEIESSAERKNLFLVRSNVKLRIDDSATSSDAEGVLDVSWSRIDSTRRDGQGGQASKDNPDASGFVPFRPMDKALKFSSSRLRQQLMRIWSSSSSPAESLACLMAPLQSRSRLR
jgi:hypothetical protein